MKRHVPAFQLEASVRCQVSGTDAEVKANREKTVNAWFAADIVEPQRELERRVRRVELYALLVAETVVRDRAEASGDRCTRTTIRGGLIQHNTSGLAQFSEEGVVNECEGESRGSSNPV